MRIDSQYMRMQTEHDARCESHEFARGPEGAIEEVENETRFVCQKCL